MWYFISGEIIDTSASRFHIDFHWFELIRKGNHSDGHTLFVSAPRRAGRMQFNIFLSRIFQSCEPLARESTAHDSGKWMPRCISVFPCSKDEGVSHSASRDYGTYMSVANTTAPLSEIFQFLILSFLRARIESQLPIAQNRALIRSEFNAAVVSITDVL